MRSAANSPSRTTRAPRRSAPGPTGGTGPGSSGRCRSRLPMSLRRHRRWGDFYAEERLAPMAELAAARLDASTRAAIDSVVARCRAGDFDDDDRPARLHGDLWSGNVMWTPDGVVLIDPAAHAGHRETDLAMLALFGCPHYDAVLAGYQRVRPLKPGWRNRIGLHQLFPLLAHVVLFGGGYAHRRTPPPAPPGRETAVVLLDLCAGRLRRLRERDDDRCVDAASDCAVPAQRHAGLAATLDRRVHSGYRHPDRGDRRDDGRGRRRLRPAQRVARLRRPGPDLQRRGRRVD